MGQNTLFFGDDCTTNDTPSRMEHLTLRQWKDADLEPFAAMNADPKVMRYFPALLTKAESAASMDVRGERLRIAAGDRGWLKLMASSRDSRG